MDDFVLAKRGCRGGRAALAGAILTPPFEAVKALPLIGASRRIRAGGFTRTLVDTGVNGL